MNRWRFRSLQTNMSLAFVLLILVMVIIMSFISYYMSKEAVKNNTQEYTTELIKQVNMNIKTYVNGMQYVSSLVASDRQVQEYLSKRSYGSMEEEKKFKESISDFFHSILLSRNDIASVSIFGYEGQFVSGRSDLVLNPYIDIRSLSWYQEARAASGSNVISSSHVQPIFQNKHQWVVSMSRELYDKSRSRKIGIFLVDLNFSVMNNMLKDIHLGKRGYLFIVDDNGKIVYHPQQQLVYSNLKTEQIDKVLTIKNGSFMTQEGNNSRIYTVQDSGFGWKIVGVSYVDELVENKDEIQLSFFVLGCVCIVFSILLSILISNRVIKPIKQLQIYMKEVEKGNFDIQVPVPFSIEIGRLARAFNIMVGRIKELMSQVVRDQELKRTSELKVLQAQINPHFLYNTLDSIIWMAESNKSKEVVLMTSSLAKLLRASISKGEELVTIQTEIEHITNYLTIQKMRYKNKLDYSIHVDESFMHYRIIKVILQPIVENAIYHGIKNKRGTGLLEITAEEMGTDLLLKVKDNGIGMDEEKLRTLLHPKPASKERGGVGVRNVHERLMLYFGSEYGLSYSSTPGAGTTAFIRIPKQHHHTAE